MAGKKPIPRGRAGLTAAGTLCLALACLALAVPSALGAKAITCTYIEAGAAGPEGNELQITVRSHRHYLRLRRVGSSVGVFSLPLSGAASSSSGDGDGGGGGDGAATFAAVAEEQAHGAAGSTPVSCVGGVPNLTDVDLIEVTGPIDRVGNTYYSNPNVLVETGGGPLGPGATDEGDGSSEIEIVIRATGGEFASPLAIAVGTPGPDRFRLGTEGGLPGINLDPGEASPDVDISAEGNTEEFFGGAFVGASTRGGADRVDASGGPEFDKPFADYLYVLLGRGDDRLKAGRGFSLGYGGPGDDQLRAQESIGHFIGGSGNDLLIGGRHSDFLIGGLGSDLMRAGPGRDQLRAGDGQHDRIRCGAGADELTADSRDDHKGCESVKRGRS